MNTITLQGNETLLQSQVKNFFTDLEQEVPDQSEQQKILDVLYIPTPEEVSTQSKIIRYKYRWHFLLQSLLKSELSLILDLCEQFAVHRVLVCALQQVALLCESDTTNFLKYLLRLQVTLFGNKENRCASYADMYYRLTENRYAVAIDHDLDMSIRDTAKLLYGFSLVKNTLVRYGHFSW